MASTNKTPKLGLNQWAAGDPVLRADFNADNAKIEAAVAPMLGNPTLGKYAGDNTANRIIELGFRPSCVLMSLQSPNNADEFQCIFEGGYHCVASNRFSFTTTIALSFNDTGFVTVNTDATNRLNCTYRYIAFR